MAQEQKVNYCKYENYIDENNINNNGNDLITIKPPISLKSSINFPSPKAAKKNKKRRPKLNHWKSAKDLDLSYISSCHKNSSADKTHKIAFLAINDPNLDVDKEAKDIKRNIGFNFTRSILTISDLEKVLIESPPIVHISTHGYHQYESVNKPNEFQIALEEPQTLRYLIDDHVKFSAYYAVIVMLFEQEIRHFVQYGFDNKNVINNKALKTWIWKHENKFALLCNPKIYAMFNTILDRYGCSYRDNERAGCVEIFWGKYINKNGNNNLQFVSPPYTPMKLYTFSWLYSNDLSVKPILKQLNIDYNASLRRNRHIAESVRPCQKFSWEILSVLLQRILTDAGAELDCDDDTQWMEPETDIDDKKCINLIQSGVDMIGVDADECAAFGVGEDDRVQHVATTQNKFNENQRLTREILIDICSQKEKIEAKKDTIKMAKLIKKLSRFKKKLIRLLKEKIDIRIGWDFASKSLNVRYAVHIIRFADEYSLTEAEKQIDAIRRDPKYNYAYDIKFRPMSKAIEWTKQQVGFIPKTQQKIYDIDIKNGTDPISLMLKKHLKSKKECKIKLLILNGCNSFSLGKIFSGFVSNVICVHPFVQILDSTATTFTRYFYESLQQYTNPRIPFSHGVLKAYNFAKTNVAKHCSNDFVCAAHSHSHPITNDHNQYIQEIQRKYRLQQFNQLHLNGNWKTLQNHINDEALFHRYRNKMKRAGLLTKEVMEDLHDGKTLIICNVSENEMNELRKYIQVCKADIEDFVKEAVYQKDEYYPELSVAYFKFKTEKHRNAAKTILSQKQYDEELIFSEQILLKSDMEDIKQDVAVEKKNLSWIHRAVPRCCCSPHHPHIVQDKLILLQNGNIINRSIINNISQIKSGLDKMRARKQQTKINKKQEEHYVDRTEEKVVPKKVNNYGNGIKQKSRKWNHNFDRNNFESKPKKLINNLQETDQYINDCNFQSKLMKSINIFDELKCTNYELKEDISNCSECSTINAAICSNISPLTCETSDEQQPTLSLSFSV